MRQNETSEKLQEINDKQLRPVYRKHQVINVFNILCSAALQPSADEEMMNFLFRFRRRKTKFGQ